MKCVAVTTTNPRDALVEVGADLVVDSLAELSLERLATLQCWSAY